MFCVRDNTTTLGTSTPSLSHLMVFLFLCSSGLDEASQGPLKGAESAQKNPSRVRDGDEGGTKEKSLSPTEGVIFHKKEAEKN